MLWRREQEDSVNACHLPVDLGYRTLKLEVRRGAKPTNDMTATKLSSKVNCQSVVCLNRHPRLINKDRLYEVNTLTDIEKAMFVRVYANGYHDMVKHIKSSGDDALVANSKGVE